MGKLGSALKAGKTAVELGRNAQGLAGAASEFGNADKGELGRAAGRHAFNEGTETGKTVGKAWLKTFETVPRMICRGLQFLFAIIACGFYGHRASSDDEADAGFSPEWVFALIVAGLSAASALLYVAVTPLGAVPFVGGRIKLLKTYRAFSWDLALCVAWLVVFGLFAGIFLHRGDGDPEYKGASTGPMKAAVWIDFVSVVLWLVSGVYGALKTFLGEKADAVTDRMGQKLFEKKNKAAAETKEADYAESV